MSISHVYKSPLPSFTFHFKNGMGATFINGRYMTDNKELIEELDKEVGPVGHGKSNHPYIYIDENDKEVDSEALSPIELIKLQAKEEARAELLKEMQEAQARSLDPSKNVSESVQSGFARSITTTDNVQENIAGNVGMTPKLKASAFNIPGQPDPSAPTINTAPKDVVVSNVTAPNTDAAVINGPEGIPPAGETRPLSSMEEKLAQLRNKPQ